MMSPGNQQNKQLKRGTKRMGGGDGASYGKGEWEKQELVIHSTWVERECPQVPSLPHSPTL